MQQAQWPEPGAIPKQGPQLPAPQQRTAQPLPCSLNAQLQLPQLRLQPGPVGAEPRAVPASLPRFQQETHASLPFHSPAHPPPAPCTIGGRQLVLGAAGTEEEAAVQPVRPPARPPAKPVTLRPLLTCAPALPSPVAPRVLLY